LPNPAGGLSNGDWAGCVVSVNASSTLTPPPTYALVPNTLQTSTTITSGVYYHIWHTGDPTSALIFQSSATANLSYICSAYKGVNENSPYDGSGSLHNSASTIATSPAVNGHANDVLLMLYGVLGSPHTFTTASEGTIESSLSSGPAAAWIDFPLTTNGLSGSQSVTFSGNANASNGIQIALLSAGATTPPPTAPRLSTQSSTATPTPDPSVSPSSLDFAKQATETTSVPQVVTLTNNESGAVTINGVSITGPNATDFAVWSSTCGSTLGSGSNCAILVIFEPSARGKRVAKLTIRDSPDSGSPHTVSLIGIGATGA